MRTIAVLMLVAVLAGCGGRAAQKPRPDLQRELDALVTGPDRVAPGVTAYVSGPKGSWSGSAGLANVGTNEPMAADARLRLESVSKLWTATVLVELAHERKLSLDHTLGRWWPSLFHGDKARITIRELLNHTSGLLDNNDLTQSSDRWLAATHDPKLRADLLALAQRLKEDPSAEFDDVIEIRWAAALPLLFRPGTDWHYSNIGYKVAGHVAERASGETLDELYHRVIIEPLHLKSAAYDPGGPIAGEHPVGYAMNGAKAIAATNVGEGALGAEGGIVSNARDEATFLQAVVRGRVVPTRDLLRGAAANGGYALGTGIGGASCGSVYAHNGGGAAWSSTVAVSKDGSRAAVILLNGRRSGGDALYAAAVLRLLCRA